LVAGETIGKGRDRRRIADLAQSGNRFPSTHHRLEVPDENRRGTPIAKLAERQHDRPADDHLLASLELLGQHRQAGRIARSG
jgi:hypothetical protein